MRLNEGQVSVRKIRQVHLVNLSVFTDLLGSAVITSSTRTVRQLAILVCTVELLTSDLVLTLTVCTIAVSSDCFAFVRGRRRDYR